jgi:glyoxylate utilization-related uncharacterized protein
MPNTYIDTNTIPRRRIAGAGEVAEILNNALCGARNVVGSLRWLQKGDEIDVRSDARTHQLVYLMEGEGTITLNAQDHQVAKGNGVYLGPSESARIRQRGAATLKLFQLKVPKQA